MQREISCRVEVFDYEAHKILEADERTILLSVDDDSRHETWETLVEQEQWGAFEDIEGFDLSDPEIVGAVDRAVAELRGMREQANAEDQA
jgi:hypothetical protein